MRKTKIVCTLGPATDSEEKIKELMLAGMDVARFNFSHGTHEEHLARYQMVCKCREELRLPVGTMLDTKGPEIRLRDFKDGKATLVPGSQFVLCAEEILGDAHRAAITHKELYKDVSPGTRILLDDGLIELKVSEVKGSDILCTVINGGGVSNHKGVNVPGVRLSLPYVSDRDREDILFGVEQGFDFLAASFVRSAKDVMEIRNILDKAGCSTMKICAKIENAEGIENIDSILKVSDSLMIARGDLGVEIPMEEIPILQKKLTKKAYLAGKPVITATQMLDSMIKNPRPTRAEATDVANAIYDGTSCIMLSGETASGKYPVEAVKTMAVIAERTEREIDYRGIFYSERDKYSSGDVTNAISHATCTTAYDLGASAIITVTQSGHTARMSSRFRPKIPIIGCTPCKSTYYHLSMSWGVVPVLVDFKDNTDDLFAHAVERSKEEGLISNGDLVIITAGVPIGISGTTNLLKVHVVGDVLVSGTGINKLSQVGTLCVARNEQEALNNFKQNDILVIPQTSNNILDLLKKASGIITETGGINSHAAIVGLTLDIPVIVGAVGATSILRSGTAVCIDAGRNIVSNVTPTGEKTIG